MDDFPQIGEPTSLAELNGRDPMELETNGSDPNAFGP